MRRIIRQRTASRWAATAAITAAVALAVTGCGQQQLGAAVLYSNQRISIARLAAEVDNLNSAYRRYKSKVQLTYPVADMPRQVLSWMLRFATVEQLAARQGIVVTPRQAQRELAAETASARQAGDTLSEAAVLSGLPPDMLPELGRWIAIQVQLEARLTGGVPASTAAQQQALSARLGQLECLAAKSLNIKVNPQYGAYDSGQSGLTSQAGVVPAASMLAAGPVPASPSPSASASPQLSPRC